MKFIQCGCCSQDSAGNHEWGCPNSPKTYPGVQVDDVVRSLMYRIATLEAQLAAVTAERDAANDDLSRVIIEREESRAETDRVMAWKRRRDGVVCGLKEERDTLRTALRTVAEALHVARGAILRAVADEDGLDGAQGGLALEAIDNSLALPAVQQILVKTNEKS